MNKNNERRQPRVSIRRKTYRHEDGFVVSAPSVGIFGTSIFVTTRTAAEWVKHLVKNGIDVELADMTLGA